MKPVGPCWHKVPGIVSRMVPTAVLEVLNMSQRQVSLDVHNGGLPMNEGQCIHASKELAGLNSEVRKCYGAQEFNA